MEDIETEDRRPRMGSYGGPPQRMPQADSSHNYYSPHPHPVPQPPSYHPPASPYESRDYPPEQNHHQGHQQGAYHVPMREHSQYAPEPPYSRSGSVTGTSRSPIEGQHHGHHLPMNGNVPQGPPREPPLGPDYRSRPGFPPHEGPPPQMHQSLPMVGPPQEASSGPPPMTPTGHYGPPPGGPPHGPPQQSSMAYDAGYYNSGMGPPYGPPGSGRRRPVRAAQACDSCRQRKAKCDEGRPKCAHCRENSLECSYRDLPPQKSDRQAAQQLEKLDVLEDMMRKLVELQEDHTSQISDLGRRMDGMRQYDPTPPMQQAGRPSQFIRTSNTEYPSDHHGHSLSSSGDPSWNPPLAKEPQLQPPPPAISEGSDELTFPLQHTTAAHKLLDWPVIRKLIPKGLSVDFVMEKEVGRGLIRLCGWGEGEDKHDGGAGPSSPASSASASNDDQTGSPAPTSASSPPEGFWGMGFGVPNSDGSRPATDHPGGLNPHRELDFDSRKVFDLVDQYLKHLHILHPFLDQKVLKTMTKSFTDKYSPKREQKERTFNAPFASGDNLLNKSKKRKQSFDESIPSTNQNPPSPRIQVAVERSVGNAIVLLVMALGKICSWTKPLPGPISSAPSPFPSGAHVDAFSPQMLNPYTQSPITTNPSGNNGYASPPAGSLSSPSGLSSRTTTSDRHETKELRNVDVIPGLAYYTMASDILGELQGGSDVSHVQACLLAGLYAGQLVHPIVSHAWISQAGRACQILIKSKRLERSHDSRKQLIQFAFWTVLQLESDILAELSDLPPSGITRMEGNVDLPSAVPEEEHLPATSTGTTATELVLLYYSSQISLRKHLNTVHTELYAKSTWTTQMVQSLSENLEGWRTTLPFSMRWDDDDSPAGDINAARLRAKYYGCRYITFRPILHAVMHGISLPGSKQRPPESPSIAAGSGSQQASPAISQLQHPGMPRRSSEMGPPLRGSQAAGFGQTSSPFEMLEPRFQEACRACVEAAIRSTTAFDGLSHRLVVTNSFGTMHAQFGNMLVLAATYKSSTLSQLVDGNRLDTLFTRTIRELRKSAAISPTLKMDAQILEHLRKEIFDGGGSRDNSFSYADS